MSFSDKVYSLCKMVPKGKVTTYKEIAKALNSRAYRAVGQALRHNPYAPLVPCHRVVSSDGSIGGFNGKKSGSKIRQKIRLLEKENIRVVAGKIQNFHKVMHRF